MSLDNIIDEIKSEYDAELKDINSKYDADKNNLKIKFDNAITRVNDFASDQKNVIKENITKRFDMAMNLDLRNEELIVRQSLVRKVFDAVSNLFDNISREDYFTLIKNRLETINLSKNIKVSCGSKDEPYIDGIKKLLVEKGLGDIDVVTTRQFDRGVEIKSGDVIYNLSIDRLLKDLSDKIIDEISSSLFENVV